MQSISHFLAKYITHKEKLIFACSWGPDSIYLLYKILETPYAKNLIVCYFDHKLRKASENEKVFIEKLWKKFGIPVEIEEIHIKKLQKQMPSISLEEIGRMKRYEFLEKVRDKYHTSFIITAHHLDDKLETFFFNLVRGSKLTWLINMTEKSGHILRPLLQVEKKEILTYLKEKKIKFMTDVTNTDTQITRNFLRLKVLPQLEKVNASYKNNVLNFISYLESAKKHIDAEILEFLDDRNFFWVTTFLEKSEFLQKEIIRYIFYTCNGKSTIGLTEGNIQEVIKFIKWRNNKTKKEIKKMKLYKENSNIYFF